jgi:CheY-like chemotaxis protein
MGGRLWVESRIGVGSTFHFTMMAKAATAQFEPLRGGHPALAGKVVLIAAGHETTRAFLERHLRRWGTIPVVATDADTALASLEGQPVHFALIDDELATADGETLAIALRRHPRFVGQPLLLLSSARRLTGADAQAQLAPMTLVHKPVRVAHLYGTLIATFAPQPVRPRTDTSPFDGGPPAPQPLRILLAEDNFINQKVALRTLERLGYQADVAANGLEAVAALGRQHYDLVLMDVQMPEMDGLEATRAIRDYLSPKHQPRIVAMTADALAETRQACLDAGMDGYISKPVNLSELTQVLQDCQARVRIS